MTTSSEATCEGCGHTYQRLPTAKSGLCCGCRKLKRAVRKLEIRCGTDAGAITTQAQLDEWYDADKLRCHICGSEFAGLYRHVGRAHGVSPTEYKSRFGIPITYGLAGRATRVKQAACAAATSKKMASIGFANLVKGRAAKTGARAVWTSYQAKDHVVCMVESPNHPSNLEGVVEMTCTSCGNTFPAPASIAASYQCRAKCPSCRL